MNNNVNDRRVVFVLGVMPRSGTHFLANLLCQHPDCEKSVIPEDGLLARAHLLNQYAHQVYTIAEKDGDLPDIPVKQILLEGIGEGLISFLEHARATVLNKKGKGPGIKTPYLVTKTPQVVNLDKFFTFFPLEKPIIIVRDGRTLAESNYLSFNYDLEEAIRDWRDAVRRILKFKEQNASDTYLVVKYEELHKETKTEMTKVLQFLGLDIDKYDFEQALNLPVVGSSVFKRGEGRVHWTPVAKNAEFKPLERAASWTRKKHERFNWIAKKELIALGYQPLVHEGQKWVWNIWNRWQDVKFAAKVWYSRWKKLVRLLTRALKIYTGKK